MRFLSCFFSLAALAISLARESAADERDSSREVVFGFKEPRKMLYRVEKPNPPRTPAISSLASPSSRRASNWVKARPMHGGTNYVEFGSRVVLQLHDVRQLDSVLAGTGLQVARRFSDRVFILEGQDTMDALKWAQRMSEHPQVRASYPVSRRPKRLQLGYARQPNDPHFAGGNSFGTEGQPYLENRDANGRLVGPDLNVRAAWPIAQGQGITLALGDDGIDLEHPDLAARVRGAPHFNFIDRTENGAPIGQLSNHGTAVAGLAGATANNKLGIAGVAPAVNLASWILFGANDELADEEGVADMFQYRSNVVHVQNHSWAVIASEQVPLTLLEDIAISNAVASGRSGRGVVIVRAAGNGRTRYDNVNDQGFTADPRAIAVGAVRLDGRVASYSTPGAAVLVAAPSGDSGEANNPCVGHSPNLLTTDRSGLLGYNSRTYTNDLADYAFGEDGFSGTSAAAPQIAGVAALILSANKELSFRDVQQVMLHSSRHYDLLDPTLQTNGAGFRVSHNLGYGVPDAGFAVSLAQRWKTRPPLTKITFSDAASKPIPDQGLRLLVKGDHVPENLRSILALPSLGPHPDRPTRSLPMFDAGLLDGEIPEGIRGKAALIQRGGEIFFCKKINDAAEGGAEFAVVYNNRDGDTRLIMGATDLTPIPAVFLSQNDGEALKDLILTRPETLVQLDPEFLTYSFSVPDTLLCEHVAVTVDSDHTSRRDLRILLISPQGSVSVLQHINSDDSPGPVDWTYYSVQHFYESSAGEWRVRILDEDSNGTGNIRSVALTISGVAIVDRDRDGLDDEWEMRHFNSMAFGPLNDVDEDGYNNAREQIMGTDPARNEIPFRLDFGFWNNQLARLAWPGNPNVVYQVSATASPGTSLTLVTRIPGTFPVTEWFTPYTNLTHQIFQVQAIPAAR